MASSIEIRGGHRTSQAVTPPERSGRLLQAGRRIRQPGSPSLRPISFGGQPVQSPLGLYVAVPRANPPFEPPPLIALNLSR